MMIKIDRYMVVKSEDGFAPQHAAKWTVIDNIERITWSTITRTLAMEKGLITWWFDDTVFIESLNNSKKDLSKLPTIVIDIHTNSGEFKRFMVDTDFYLMNNDGKTIEHIYPGIIKDDN